MDNIQTVAPCKERNLTIDIIKGFLIILVVAGHSYWEYREIVFWFHMPVFFMVSGYLLNVPEKVNEKRWILRKCKALLIPYLAYAFVIGLFESTSGAKDIAVYWARCFYGGEAVGGVYWFITVLLLSEVIIVLIENRVSNQVTKVCIYAAMYLAAIAESMCIIPPDTIQVPAYTKLPWNIDVCLIAIPYMMVGVGLRKKKEQIRYLVKSPKGILAIVTATLALSWALYFTHALNWFTLDMKYSQYKNVILDMLCPIIFGAFIWLISRGLSTNLVGKCIGYIGKRSLSVMYLHILLRDKFVIVVFGEQYSIFVYLVAVIVFCMLWDFGVSRFPKVAFGFGVKPTKA